MDYNCDKLPWTIWGFIECVRLNFGLLLCGNLRAAAVRLPETRDNNSIKQWTHVRRHLDSTLAHGASPAPGCSAFDIIIIIILHRYLWLYSPKHPQHPCTHTHTLEIISFLRCNRLVHSKPKNFTWDDEHSWGFCNSIEANSRICAKSCVIFPVDTIFFVFMHLLWFEGFPRCLSKCAPDDIYRCRHTTDEREPRNAFQWKKRKSKCRRQFLANVSLILSISRIEHFDFPTEISAFWHHCWCRTWTRSERN